MLAKAPRDPKRRMARRKVTLACDSCREKKIRCDGIKPICGPCERRSYRIDQCIYNTENARSASRDEYIHTLHQRIRELEDANLKGGVSIQTPSNPPSQVLSEASGLAGMPPGGTDLFPSAGHSLPAATVQYPTSSSFEAGVPRGHRQPATHSHRDNSQSTSIGEATTESCESPLFEEGEGQVTGMGQITAPAAEDRRRSARFQFYGSSSTASLTRFAWQSMPSRPIQGSRAEPVFSTLQDSSNDYRFDDFTLPPRMLADHLLKCFFDKIYILYPFFHRPAFEAAYRNVWRGEDDPDIPLTDLQIGLGSSSESGPRSIVFHCALNLMFALGCQFADIHPEEVEPAAQSFFLRAKRFIGLDFLDINTLGVVQTLLITALFLQSSPFPSRCWNSVGVACRVALGLGLHGSNTLAKSSPLESDIRWRAWHGCVMMDITVSMTYGRPSMTTHLAPLPPPREPHISSHPDVTVNLMTFYTEAIKLYDILDRILADVYNSCRGRPTQHESMSTTTRPGGLDTILDIGMQLTMFESNLPSFLKWSADASAVYADGVPNAALAQQRHVLHARYIHLHLLLYRPIFTQLYSENVRTRGEETGPELQENSIFSVTAHNTLYSSMASKCATACVMAAIELTHLVHETYQTNAADAWWYNGFYVSTAAIVLLISFSAPLMLDTLTIDKARGAWREAMTVLEFMAPFRRSASNTLQFLQAAYLHAVPCGPQQAGPDADTSQLSSEISQSNDLFDHLDTGVAQTPLFNCEELSENMGPGLDDLGFLTRLDFPDTLV